MTIPSKYTKWKWWIAFEWIKLSENDLQHIYSFPQEIFEKLQYITEIELWKEVIEWKISVEEARWAIQYAKYLKTYFKK